VDCRSGGEPSTVGAVETVAGAPLPGGLPQPR